MPPSSESYTFAKKSLRLESQIARCLTICLYLFVFPLSFATRSVGIVITGPFHVLKSQNKLYLLHLACHYLMDMLNKRESDLQAGKINKAMFLWLCSLIFKF